jgi:hypothetical protein
LPLTAALIRALRDPARFPHPAGRIERIETHISWVLLAGEYAYKIKKPLRLGFLDFSTLAARRRCCEEELRLNRRTAPELYLEVVAIAGTPDAPILGGTGAPIEYAVKMRRFADEALLDRLARRGALEATIVDRLAERIAAFHASAAAAPAGGALGAPEAICAQTRANFDDIARLTGDSLQGLRAWSEAELQRLAPVFAARLASGWCASATATCTWATSRCSTAIRRPSTASSSATSCAGSTWRASSLFWSWTCSITGSRRSPGAA